MQQYQTGVNLPVSAQQVDGSCFNQQLPQGNDMWPQVSFIPGADTNLGSYAISLFRTYAQSRAAKSSIHCLCYNLLQQNRFQNQYWQGWCQYVVDFCDFLHRGQQHAPQQAADKAASRIYQSMLATTIQQYPAVRNMVDANTQAGLADAAQVANKIMIDVNNWKAQIQSGGVGHGGGVGYGVGGGGGLGVAGAGNIAHVNSFSVAPAGASPSLISSNQNAGSVGSTGLFLGADNAVPAKPTSSWSGGSGVDINQGQNTQPVQGIAQLGAGAPASPLQMAQSTDVIDHNHEAPISVADLKIDPRYYVPQGFKPVDGRPYDIIRNPGGVEIRPAYQALAGKDAASWKRTVGGDAPYAMLYDPNKYICFLAKWVDGIVKEVVVPIEPEMDYLKHEINDDLRRKAMRPAGVVIPLPQYSQSDDQTVKTIEVTKAALQSGEVEPEYLSPVALSPYLTGTSDLENEAMAAKTVREQLGLKADDPTPPHEYLTAKMHELDISQECFNALFAFEQYTTPSQVVDGLKKLLESGLLPLRYYTFINTRLTQAVNDFLRDSLSIDKIRIASYFDAAVELGPYLAKKRGEDYQLVYEGNTKQLVARSMSVACEQTDGEEGQAPVITYGIVDEYLNFQMGLPSEVLSNLNLTTEPCLISKQSHPHLETAIKSMVLRARERENLHRIRLRLITSDGFYYDVIVGKLVKGALLLKRSA